MSTKMSDTQICTGSHMNHRTFHEDDYWESFQSTILSGQVMNDDKTIVSTGTTATADETNIFELSSLLEDEMTEENLLNMNLDIIADGVMDDEFYDCPSFEKSPANLVKKSPQAFNIVFSPRPYNQPQFYTVQFSSPPENSISTNNSSHNYHLTASPRKPRPHSPRISPSRVTVTLSKANESSPNVGARTASLIIQAIEDFNNLKDHAQSTPKLSSDSGNPSSSGSFTVEVSTFDPIQNSARKLFDSLEIENMDTIPLSEAKKQEEMISSENKDQNIELRRMSDKENFFNGVYSKFVIKRRDLEKTSPKVRGRPGKVALYAEYFERRADEETIQNKTTYKSRIPLPIRKNSQILPFVKKSPQAKARISGNPSYLTRKSYKLVSSRSSSSSRIHPSTATTFSSSGSDSFLTRNQRKLSRTSRVQSCSDATNAEIVSIDETCKSQSTGNLTSGQESTVSIKALRSSKITMRTYGTIEKSPMQKNVLPKKSSAIQNRRSVGAQLKNNSSPVKPVKELCKLFTPSKRQRKNSSGNVTQRKLSVPKIVISYQK